MGKVRTWGGIVLSVAYLGWITLIVYPKFESVYNLDLNELGDFFAGIFGPLAFL